jgi:hypothetical protein
MQLRARHHRPTSPGPSADGSAAGRGPGSRVFAVQRTGAVVVALVILVFGVLGFAGGLEFFSTDGAPVLGMSSNGLLSTVSVVTAVVLLAAAASGPRLASTLMLAIGTSFVLAGLAGLAVLRSSWNLLAFEMSNVAFSVVAGLLLLTLGAYGRISGNLPPDSPYARPAEYVPVVDETPGTPEEAEAERAMRDAEIAVVHRTATPEQARRVAAMARVRSRSDRRRVWLECERGTAH